MYNCSWNFVKQIHIGVYSNRIVAYYTIEAVRLNTALIEYDYLIFHHLLQTKIWSVFANTALYTSKYIH